MSTKTFTKYTLEWHYQGRPETDHKDEGLEISEGAGTRPRGTVNDRTQESSLLSQMGRSPSWVWAVLSRSFWFIDNCCPVGWILNERSCFYISYAERTWEESQNHCKSLSSELATFNDISYSFSVSIPCLQIVVGTVR